MTDPAATVATLGRVFGLAAVLLRGAGLVNEAVIITRCTALPASPCAQRALDAIMLTTRMAWGAKNGAARTLALSTAYEAVALANAVFVASSVWPENRVPSEWLAMIEARLMTLAAGPVP
jgi:hypothetical protein